jgi:hypothetical protein
MSHTGAIHLSVTSADAALAGRVVTVELLRQGALVERRDVRVGGFEWFDRLPAGTYLVRVAGAGLTPLVRRGVHVLSGAHTSVWAGPVARAEGAGEDVTP